MPIPIVGVGAGGHAKSVLEAIRSAGAFEVVALVDDDPTLAGTVLLGDHGDGRPAGTGARHAFLGVGGIGDPGPRQRVCERLLAEGFELPPIVHASAAVSPWATLGRGAQILAAAVVNADATLGDGVLINTAAVVEHDCVIGDVRARGAWGDARRRCRGGRRRSCGHGRRSHRGSDSGGGRVRCRRGGRGGGRAGRRAGRGRSRPNYRGLAPDSGA